MGQIHGFPAPACSGTAWASSIPSPAAQHNAEGGQRQLCLQLEFSFAFFLFLPGLCVGTGEDSIYSHSAKASHICNPNILSVPPCMTYFKHLYLQKLNTDFHATPAASRTQNNSFASNLQLFNPALTLFPLWFKSLCCRLCDSLCGTSGAHLPADMLQH